MAYAAKLVFFLSGELLLLDAGFFTSQVAEVEDAGPAEFPAFVQLDGFDSGGLVRENSFHTDAAGNFADGKGPGERGAALDLDHDTSELLEPFLITFFDAEGHRDGVTGLEGGILSHFLVGERLLY